MCSCATLSTSDVPKCPWLGLRESQAAMCGAAHLHVLSGSQGLWEEACGHPVPPASKDTTCQGSTNQPGLASGCPSHGGRCPATWESGCEPHLWKSWRHVGHTEPRGREAGWGTHHTLRYRPGPQLREEPGEKHRWSGLENGPQASGTARHCLRTRTAPPRAYLVFHPVQAGTDAVVTSVLALLCGKSRKSGMCMLAVGEGRAGDPGWAQGER